MVIPLKSFVEIVVFHQRCRKKWGKVGICRPVKGDSGRPFESERKREREGMKGD